MEAFAHSFSEINIRMPSMKKLLLATALLGVCASGAMADDYRDRGDRDRGDRDRGGILDVPGAIIGGTVRALEGRSIERDGDCRIVIERRRSRDGDIVETRRRECD